MNLYAFADALISAGFRNRLRLAKILSGKAVVKSFGENYARICLTYMRLVVCNIRHVVPMFFPVIFLPVVFNHHTECISV